MKLAAITLNNFRCFGPEPQTIPLENGLAALLGSNGAGKSSVIKYIQQLKPEWSYFQEPIEKWQNWNGANLLTQFYENPRKNAYKFETAVLESFAERIPRRMDGCVINVWERSPESAIRVFASHLANVDILTKSELQKLVSKDEEGLNWFRETPHLKVYLRTNPLTAYKRAVERRRPGEVEKLTLAYLTRIHHYHECTFGNETSGSVLVVDETNTEMVVDKKARMVVSTIEAIMKQLL